MLEYLSSTVFLMVTREYLKRKILLVLSQEQKPITCDRDVSIGVCYAYWYCVLSHNDTVRRSNTKLIHSFIVVNST